MHACIHYTIHFPLNKGSSSYHKDYCGFCFYVERIFESLLTYTTNVITKGLLKCKAYTHYEIDRNKSIYTHSHMHSKNQLRENHGLIYRHTSEWIQRDGKEA